MHEEQHVTAGLRGTGIHLQRTTSFSADHDRAGLTRQFGAEVGTAAIDDQALRRMSAGIDHGGRDRGGLVEDGHHHRDRRLIDGHSDASRNRGK